MFISLKKLNFNVTLRNEVGGEGQGMNIQKQKEE